jgi:VWFA-related protein
MFKLKILLLTIIIGTFVWTNFAQNNDDVIKIDTALVNLPVIVSDRDGRYISGLKQEDFSVFQDGEKQKIEIFASEESPINVAILLDTSRSTQDVLGKIRKAAKEFIKNMRPEDKAMIVSFDDNVEILSQLTSDKKVLKNAIEDAKIGDYVGTVLNDAVYNVVKNQFAKIKGRKAIILLTDGKDHGSYVNQRELLYQMQESDTMIYSIYYETGDNFRQIRQNRFPNDDFPFPNRRRRFPDNFPRQRPNNERKRQRIEENNEQAIQFLQNLADTTAGRFYKKDVTDLEEAFQAIAEELRKQYLIGYYPETNDDKIHQVKVKVNRENAVIRAKTSYRLKKNQ